LDTGWFFAAALLGLVELAAGRWFARDLLRLQGRWRRAMLGTDPAEGLRERVDHLATTRATALELQEAELRRIERDLHDGAQARLVATGMTIDRAVELLDSDPEAARRLLDAAKSQQSDALGELRALVRGIRPPVLADRGLADALHALAATASLRVTIDSRLEHRLAGSLESALYFAAAELIANSAKHADPTRVEVELAADGGRVALAVRDDGRGGADAARPEGGLAGIRRRLAPFDGELTIDSPLGGPTVATVSAPEVRAGSDR
ncbi:MAG: sensor histidine kinase, partial [Microbacteriaceae bacterium]|nr:sensor histidine kinase [Microbacteriaceae bacterium]